jgi:hypothetical protein
MMSRLGLKRTDLSLWLRSSNIAKTRHTPTEAVPVTGVPAGVVEPPTPAATVVQEAPATLNPTDAVDEVAAADEVEIAAVVDVDVAASRETYHLLLPLPQHPLPNNTILKTGVSLQTLCKAMTYDRGLVI